MNLHQFSFSQYDDVEWSTQVINGVEYPMSNGEIVTIDNNFQDVVVHDTQRDLIQKQYDHLLVGLGLDSMITATVTPNHYGSIYIVWSSEDHDELVDFLSSHQKAIDEENLCYHEGMEAYEEIVNAYQMIYNCPEDNGYTDDEGYEDHVRGCKVLDFEPDEKTEWVTDNC